ncbi:MAG: phosphoribosylaminoimidazolesuccinocarboxamide synthase [Bradymonadales bacterium]|nr:MAG: phosphoribosylaminoimidazolesuccinocarboxamide synthase [Bradymonadales bacterium]
MQDLLYEGKAKKIYREGEGLVRQRFKDIATAFNGEKKATVVGKAALNARFCALFFELLEKEALPTHFVSFDPPDSLITLELKMIPLEVVVRNRVAGSLSKRFPAEDKKSLEPPVVEYFLKNDAQNDPKVEEDLLVSLFHYDKKELLELRSFALKVNEILGFFVQTKGVDLIDLKLEFGRSPDGSILLGDEISPDTCRFWDVETGESLDKDRFRFEKGDLIEGYQKLATRLGLGGS